MSTIILSKGDKMKKEDTVYKMLKWGVIAYTVAKIYQDSKKQDSKKDDSQASADAGSSIDPNQQIAEALKTIDQKTQSKVKISDTQPSSNIPVTSPIPSAVKTPTIPMF